MEMWYHYPMLVLIGFVVGFINTIAGGGSLLSLPFLIFLGLPPAVANGTNDNQPQVHFPCGPPAHRRPGLDLEIAPLARGSHGNLLPGDVRILADLLRGGQSLAVKSSASTSALCRRLGAQFGVFADAADQGGVRGQRSQHLPVGVAAVNDHVQRGCLAAVVLGALLLQLVEAFGGQRVEIALLHFLLVGFDLLGGGAFAGLARRGGVPEDNGDHAHLVVFVGDGPGDLEFALSPDQIEVEGRPQRIPAVGRARDGSSGLAQNGVVQGDAKPGVSRAQGLHLPAKEAEDRLLVDALPGVEAVVGAPVLELPAEGGDQRGEGVASRTNQMSQEMLAQSGLAGGGRGGLLMAAIPKRLPLLKQRGGVFF